MKAFISHSSIDKPFVERLATDLRTRITVQSLEADQGLLREALNSL